MKVIAAIMLVFTVVSISGCGNGNGNENDNSGGFESREDSTEKIVDSLFGSCEGHEWVDLGLLSGTLWATCNIGANTPEECGDYFAWGETKSKITYNWNTYEYCNGDDGWNSLTKYCIISHHGFNGFSDNLTMLQPSDDAATANWGGGWCTPTMEQWEELDKNTTQDWTTQNGVTGLRFTASNGNSLFLPAAGGRWGDDLHDVGSWGYCWSSTYRTEFSYDAWGFFFNADTCGMSYHSRYYGLSVRPVRSLR